MRGARFAGAIATLTLVSTAPPAGRVAGQEGPFQRRELTA